ncbi:MAG: hypothetical protein EXX96DRAFT_577554 [Benjaminiella poitrasii]|nr:MAG: hypothetical protein EXX96DRAFT_577554 [Benjaminiella poitrasii]
MSNAKTSRKPKPLFSLFRKNKPEPVVVMTTTSTPQQPSLGSGVSSSIPFSSSVLSPTQQYYFQISPKLPKPSISDTNIVSSSQQQQQQQQQYSSSPANQKRRQRSKSVGREPSSISQIRLLEERESAFKKLCQKELINSPPIMSPKQHSHNPSLPPVPPIPLCHQQNTISPKSPHIQKSIKKSPSAHDFRKIEKLHQETIQQTVNKVPMPTINTNCSHNVSRSKSLGISSHKLKQSRSQQQLRTRTKNCPETEDDDNIPLGFLHSPPAISKPSSLLNDQEDEDDNDLIPIAAALATVKHFNEATNCQTAADKYKQRVKERLKFDAKGNGDDDDDIPISLVLLSPNKDHGVKK